jgi:hypothetical protein
VRRTAPSHHRSSTVRPPLRRLPSPVGISSSSSSTYPSLCNRVSSRAYSSFAGRRATATSSGRRRRASSPPDQNPKPGQEHPWTTPCTLPPGHGRRPRQNFAIAPATAPRGDIAKRKVFSRACLQIGNSNSKAILLILVNCVENRRNIRFCCIRGEKSYNFCYSLLS